MISLSEALDKLQSYDKFTTVVNGQVVVRRVDPDKYDTLCLVAIELSECLESLVQTVDEPTYRQISKTLIRCQNQVNFYISNTLKRQA